jgi:dipeptidyl aminopeptidase/acylaminoacyl peptidase
MLKRTKKGVVINCFIYALSIFITSSSVAKKEKTYSGLGKESVDEATIKKFIPAPIDSKLAEIIQQYLDVRAPSAGRLSPDGKTLYFHWGVTGITQIWKKEGVNGFPIQMTGGKDQTLISDITEDGKYLIVSRDKNGEENPGIYLLPTSGGQLIEIQKKEKVQTNFARLSDDGEWIYYTANDISAESYAIYRYNYKNKIKELLFSQPGTWGLTDIRNDDEILLEKATGSIWREYSVFNIKTKKLKPLLGQNEKEEYDVAFAKNAGEYLVLTPKFGEFKRLYLLKQSDEKTVGEWSPVSEDIKFDVEQFAIDRQRKRIYYEVNENGYTRLHAMEAKNFKKLELPKLDGIHVYIGSISKDGDTITLGVDTTKAPRSNYIFNWKNEKLEQWVVGSAPEINTKNFVEEKLEYYDSRDGVKIPMFVKRPEGCSTQSCPVIVDFHGGPEGQSRPMFYPIDQLFIEAGFVIVRPNVRGSEGYGKSWLNSDNGPLRLKTITDIEDCSIYIKKHWSFNGITPKIGIMGGSYGGYSTLMGMTYFAGAYDAGVATVGMSNLVTFLMNTAPYRRALRISEYGDPEKDKDALIKLSPMTYVEKVKSPLMIIQGVNDPRVPVGEALYIHNSLQKQKTHSELLLFGDEGHGIRKRENRLLEIGHTLDFFKKHLKK